MFCRNYCLGLEISTQNRKCSRGLQPAFLGKPTNARASSRGFCCVRMRCVSRGRPWLDFFRSFPLSVWQLGPIGVPWLRDHLSGSQWLSRSPSGDPEPVPPIQHLMQFPPIVAVYEGLWRPIGYFIASNHSFPKDVDRIASLIQRRHGLILDLACGPGNFTRRIARLAPESLVVGSIFPHRCSSGPCA